MPSDHEGLAIHWPSGFTPDDADYHFRAESVIKAPPEQLYGYLTELRHWPMWVPGVSEVFQDNPGSRLGLQESFQFRLFGVMLECLIGEFLPNSRLGWSGLGQGLHFYHAWTFESRLDATVVVTEQAARGATAVTMRGSHPEWENFLGCGWLHALKQRGEAC